MEITIKKWLLVVAMTVSPMSLCQHATANEPADALSDSDTAPQAEAAPVSTRLDRTEALDMLRESARRTQAGRDDTEAAAHALDIERVDKSAMLERMIELEALPFVKVTDKDGHRVYFGISFDGVLGLHGNF